MKRFAVLCLLSSVFCLLAFGQSGFLPNRRAAFLATDAVIPTGNLMAWYAASEIDASDGDALASWTDKSGNSRNLVQSSATHQPLLRTSGPAGKQFVEFNGTTHHFTNFSTWHVTNLHCFIVQRFHRPTAYDCFFTWTVAGTTWYVSTNGIGYQFSSPATSFIVFAESGANDLSLSAAIGATNVWRLFEFSFTDSTSQFYSNSVSVVTDTHTSVPRRLAERISIGTGFSSGAADTSLCTKQDVAEMLFYSDVLSEGDRALVLEALNAKYSLW